MQLRRHQRASCGARHACFVLVVLLTSRSASAATFAEIPDAPSVLPAQAAVGIGALDQITGSLATTSDVDMFRIRIDDPASFHAETFSPLDSQLFLDAGLPGGNASLPLSQSDEIMFKDFKIKVLRATNSEIEFIILDDGVV